MKYFHDYAACPEYEYAIQRTGGHDIGLLQIRRYAFETKAPWVNMPKLPTDDPPDKLRIFEGQLHVITRTGLLFRYNFGAWEEVT